MKGVYFPGNGTACVREWPTPQPGEGEVLIKVMASALCRSDMKIYHGEPSGRGTPAGTCIPGHEPSGIVTAAGHGTRFLKEGDRVAVTCFVGCGACSYCRSGETNLCSQTEIIGMDRHGGDAEFLVAPEWICLRLPDEMNYVVGALSTDALGNLYATMKEMRVNGDDLVAVIGLGPMGLSGILAAKGMGATAIAIDVVESRLQKAKELGADHTINAKEMDPREAVRILTKGKGVNKSVECSASPQGIATALDITGKHGIVAQLGETVKRGIEVFPSRQLNRKKLTWYGSWYIELGQWDEITNFIINRIGLRKAEEIVSHRYALDDQSVDEAFRLFDEHKTYKVVFTPHSN